MSKLQKTKGIVIKTFKYGETSLIAKVYTEAFGLQSYIVNGVRKAKGKLKMGMLQPLSLLDMVVYHKDTRSMHRFKEIKPFYTFNSIPFHVAKSAIALFITEILFKTLKEETSDPQQFLFLEESIKYLDTTQASIANYHLSFLIKWSGYLGFHPQNNFFYTERPIFNLLDGEFTYKIPTTHNNYLQLPISYRLSELLKHELSESHNISMSNDERRTLLQSLVTFYCLHIENLATPKSLPILEQVFS